MKFFLNKLKSYWTDFFFRPASPAPLCLFRVFFGLTVILSFIDCLPSAMALFGSDGFTSQTLVHSLQHGYRIGLYFWLTPDTVNILGGMIVLIIASLSLTVGYKSRLSAFIVWFMLLSFRNRNPYVWNCGDDLIQIIAFLMILGPAGAMYSLDALKRPKTPEFLHSLHSSPWVQRLIQIQLCLVYVVSFFCKTGQTWHDGTAVYYAMHIKFFTDFVPPYLFDHLWTCKLLTWSTLTIEFSLFTLIWVRSLRLYVIAVGICMHLCMLVFMNLHVLELIMLACYINFADADTVERCISLITTKARDGARKLMPGVWRPTGGA